MPHKKSKAKKSYPGLKEIQKELRVVTVMVATKCEDAKMAKLFPQFVKRRDALMEIIRKMLEVRS